jgi:ABC-type uncharacterized transport system fused permease/ATPase subunit
MDIATEKQMYPSLKTFQCTYISVGHRPTLFSFHDLRLHLKKTHHAGETTMGIGWRKFDLQQMMYQVTKLICFLDEIM